LSDSEIAYISSPLAYVLLDPKCQDGYPAKQNQPRSKAFSYALGLTGKTLCLLTYNKIDIRQQEIDVARFFVKKLFLLNKSPLKTSHCYLLTTFVVT